MSVMHAFIFILVSLKLIIIIPKPGVFSYIFIHIFMTFYPFFFFLQVNEPSEKTIDMGMETAGPLGSAASVATSCEWC